VSTAAAACGGSDGDREGNQTGIASLSDTGTATATAGDDDSPTPTAGDADGTAGSAGTIGSGPGFNPKFDVASMPDIFTEESGCTKVDFLFVIDNSGSMQDEQANLIANFPGFISGIQSVLANVDEYQVGVVTTDAYTYNQGSPGCNVMGGLVTQTGGSFSSNQVCVPYASGANYMTEADDLPTAFSCAAQVGTNGSGTERPMQALINVAEKVNGGPGQCNDGFLRDDALLVAVIITDEWDGPNDPETQGSAGDPMSWYNSVVAAKLGIPENVVIVSLINYAGGPCPPASSAFDGVHIATFTQLFGVNGFLGGVCQADYGPTFDAAIAVIENACNNFVPPG
jgi:hypothetical protein